jgi:hypothetical protein
MHSGVTFVQGFIISLHDVIKLVHELLRHFTFKNFLCSIYARKPSYEKNVSMWDKFIPFKSDATTVYFLPGTVRLAGPRKGFAVDQRSCLALIQEPLPSATPAVRCHANVDLIMIQFDFTTSN